MFYKIKELSNLNGFYNLKNELETIGEYNCDDVFYETFQEHINFIPLERFGINRLASLDFKKYYPEVNAHYFYTFTISKKTSGNTYSGVPSVEEFEDPYEEFPHFEKMIVTLFPEMTYINYKLLKAEFLKLIQTGTVYINEYYGDSTTYKYSVIAIEDVLTLMKDYTGE